MKYGNQTKKFNQVIELALSNKKLNVRIGYTLDKAIRNKTSSSNLFSKKQRSVLLKRALDFEATIVYRKITTKQEVWVQKGT